MQLNIFRKSYWRQRSNKKVLRQIKANTDYFFTVSYRKNTRSELSRLCQKHGTDKGAINPATHPKNMGRIHNYADFYEMLFGGMRRPVKSVLECGIGQHSKGGVCALGRSIFRMRLSPASILMKRCCSARSASKLIKSTKRTRQALSGFWEK